MEDYNKETKLEDFETAFKETTKGMDFLPDNEMMRRGILSIVINKLLTV